METLNHKMNKKAGVRLLLMDSLKNGVWTSGNRQRVNRQLVDRQTVNRQLAQQATGEQATGEQTT